MVVMPGYKETEVGIIPEDWSIRPLGLICDVRDGTHESPRFFKDGVPFVTSKNIVDGRLDLESVSFISKSDAVEFDKRSRVDRNDILLSMIGTIGSAVLVDCEPDFCIKNVALIKPRKVAPTYLIRLINAPVFQRYLADNLDGGIQKFISLGKLRQLSIPLPNEIEQRAIATALSDVDALITNLDQFIAKKRDIKQAAMQQLLTGKTRLPGFSGEWEVKRLGDITSLIRGGVYGEERPRPSLVAARVATTAHIEMDDTWNDKEMGIRYFSREQIQHYSPIEGDLVVVKSSGSAASIQSGKIGYVSREEAGQFVFSNFLMLLRPLKGVPRFFYFYLSSHNVKKLIPSLVEASTYPNIRIPEYLEIEIPVPPEAEQTAIANVFSDMDAELADLEARRDKTYAIKQGMMQELLTGRIRLPVNPEPSEAVT